MTFSRSSIRSLRRRGARQGFTLTELLVVVAIIVLLIGSIFVALGAAARRAQKVRTQFLLGSISTGLAQFQTDFGYLPPVLGSRDTGAGATGLGRDVVRFAQAAGGSDVERQQNWLSYTTLAEYLIGYGNRSQDGYGAMPANSSVPGSKENPVLGIRAPGSDGCWGAIDAPQSSFASNPNFGGYYRARNPSRDPAPPAVNDPTWNARLIEGRVYGPYVDSIDERLIGGLTGFDPSGRPLVVTAEQWNAGNPTIGFDQLPKCILDYWGEPIAYYRAPYVANDIRSEVPNGAGGFLNLGDVYALRQWDVAPDDVSVGSADMAGDTTSSVAMKGASFALLSKGADRAFDRTVRRDVAEFNKDNVMETGK